MRYDMKCLDCGSIHEVVCSYSQLMESKVPGPWKEPRYDGPCPGCMAHYASVAGCKIESVTHRSRQVQTFPIGQERNHIHSQHTGMYGKFHPGFGCVVEDYGHKQQLLRRWDLREAADKIDGAPAGWGDSDEGTNYDLNRPEEVKAAAKAEGERKQKALDSIQWS
jgi:hypothetical protein